MRRPLSVAPFVALPNESALLAREVRAMFTSVDGPIRQIWPFHAWPTYTGTPTIVPAQAGGYALANASGVAFVFTEIHAFVDLSSASVPLAWIVRFDRIGPASEFSSWGGVAQVGTQTASILNAQRSGVSDTMSTYINGADAQNYSNFLASERMDCVLVAQSYGSGGRTIATSVNGELITSPYGSAAGDRATTTTDGRLIFSNGSVRVRDAFIFNRQLSVEEVRELSQPGALWQFYRDPNERRIFLPAASSVFPMIGGRMIYG